MPFIPRTIEDAREYEIRELVASPERLRQLFADLEAQFPDASAWLLALLDGAYEARRAEVVVPPPIATLVTRAVIEAERAIPAEG